MNNNLFYKIANYIIYFLITILLLLIIYNIAIIISNFSKESQPKNSIRVSPKYNLEEENIETSN